MQFVTSGTLSAYTGNISGTGSEVTYLVFNGTDQLKDPASVYRIQYTLRSLANGCGKR